VNDTAVAPATGIQACEVVLNHCHWYPITRVAPAAAGIASVRVFAGAVIPRLAAVGMTLDTAANPDRLAVNGLAVSRSRAVTS